jgi:outer membrane protein assembly factor BamB
MLSSFLQACFNKNRLQLLWQAPIASQAAPIVQDGIVYVTGIRAGHPGEPTRLFALDALTGQEKWVSADSVYEVYGVSGGSVFFNNMAKRLVQLNAQTGEKLHESEDESTQITHCLVRGDTMFIINGAQEVVAVDNRRNKVLWRRQLPFGPGADTDLQMSGNHVIASGNFRNSDEQFGMVWALDAATGAELWHFEPPEPHDFAPLKIYVYPPWVLATNTAPTNLGTHVLDLETGKEPYPRIYAFDFYGYRDNTAYASNGAFDLRTGERTGSGDNWVPASFVYKGIGWARKISSVGAGESFFLRNVYDGDYRGTRDWTNTPPNSAVEGTNLQTGKPVKGTKIFKYTQFSEPVESGGILYHSSIAVMKEGTSGVWAYRLPGGR